LHLPSVYSGGRGNKTKKKKWEDRRGKKEFAKGEMPTKLTTAAGRAGFSQQKYRKYEKGGRLLSWGGNVGTAGQKQKTTGFGWGVHAASEDEIK